MFLNADATLRKSDAKGDGWRNEVAQGIAAFSDALRLTSLRGSVDDALGKNQGTDTDVEELLAQQEAEPPTARPTRPRHRPRRCCRSSPRPRPTTPLRFWVGGDSITQTFGTSMQQVAQSTGVMTPTLDYRVSTGLARPDYFNWPEHFVKDILPSDPQVMVVMFGANDGQGMTGTDGKVYTRGTPEWLEEYRRRVAATMDLLKDPDNDRLVIWVGRAGHEPGSGVHEMDQLNYIYWSEAESRPWIQYFDTWPFFSDANMQYVERGPVRRRPVPGPAPEGRRAPLDHRRQPPVVGRAGPHRAVHRPRRRQDRPAGRSGSGARASSSAPRSRPRSPGAE